MYTNGMNSHGRPNRARRRAEGKKARTKVKEASLRDISPISIYREVLLLLAAITSVLLFVAPAMAEDGVAKLRMVHLSPDAPEVMITLDGEPVEALANVAYKDASPYLEIPAGPHEVAVYATADATTPVLEVEVAPEAGSSYTIAGMGLLEDGTFGAKLFEDDTEKPEDGKFKVRVIHGIPDVGPATVSVAGGPDLFALPGFTNASDYAEADPGTYTFDVTPAGADAPAFSVPDVAAQEGKVYTAFAIGKAADGTVGAIITDDSDNGKVILTQGGGGESDAPATKSHPQEIQNPVSAPQIEADLEAAAEKEAAEKAAAEKEAAEKKAATEKEKAGKDDGDQGRASENDPAQKAPAEKETAEAAPVQEAAPAAEVATVESAPVVEVPPAPVAEIAPVVESVPLPEVAPVEVPVNVPQVEVNPSVNSGYVPEVYVPEVDVSGIVSGVTAGVTQVTSTSTTVTSSANAVTGQPVTELPDATYIVDQTLAQVETAVPVTSGFVPPVPETYVPDVQVPQTTSVPAPDVPAPDAPVSDVSVSAVVNQTAAVVNSSTRRKFVSIGR